MENRHCPYLGIIDDPSTNKDFPYEGNACHRAQKPVKIILEYQETTCLCDAYRECPGYTRGWENGFPLELRADYDPTTKNIFKRFQFWKEEQQRKLSQRKKQREQREKVDWKERRQSKIQFKKEQPEKEKITPDKELISKKGDVVEETQPNLVTEPQELGQEKKILQDETALKEYLRSKRSLKNPLKSILSKNKEPKQKAEEKKLKETKLALTEQKQKKSLKEVLQNILPWKKDKQLKQSRKKAIEERLSLDEEEPTIESTPELVQAEEISKEEVQPIEAEPEALPNVWVKEEEQFIEKGKKISKDETYQEEQVWVAERQIDEEEALPDVVAWRDRQKSKRSKKEGLFSKLFGKKKAKQVKQRKGRTSEGVMALRDKRRAKTGWKKVFKDRRVWWVSLGIILIFLLVIFIPQLPSVNLDIRERFEGLFNPPIAGTAETTETTETIADTPTSVFEGITQTEAIPPTATEAAVNTPGEETTPTDTPTATIAPTDIPTSTPSPGVPPFIYLTPETPEP